MSESSERSVAAMTGRTLGDFVVGELIGQGGFGAVYRAQQPLLERDAVIKVIARGESASEEQVARFLREARLASQLDHPYAAHIYAFGAESDGLQWIAMELVRGSTLADLIATSGPLPIERFVPLFDRICEVVGSAHEQGIVHRDIKPENVMVLSRAGRLLPKLLDLGIAKAVGSDVAPASALAGGKGANLAVTGAHGMLGSPRYMAPELWFAPQTAGPSVDQYALGALAHELLTGEPAFPGESLEAVAIGHAKKPAPRLPDDFPADFAEAIEKSMGKRPGDRFESVLEFADAVRQGSGLEIKPAQVPELDAELVAEVATSYPRPIVESIAAYSAAHNAHQARDAVRGLVSTVSRYIGVLALCCRSRLGESKSENTPRATELLVELRRTTLTDAEWVELATEVCRPFARRPDTFPLPELVLALFPTRDPRSPHDPLADFEGHSGVFEGTTASDDAILSAVAELTGAIGRLLRSISFTADYPLVVPVGDRVELWTAARPRVARTQPRPPVGELDDGRPILLDRGGVPVLSLWPLIQCREPTPGSPTELFMFEGATRRGARLLSRPIGFEISDADLWEWFAAELLEAASDNQTSEKEADPYLGMSTFSAADAENFFGREREVDAVANRLRTQSFIAVVGPSGAGKSSFVHAGVVPALTGWRAITLRPGATPMANLEARLARENIDGSDDLSDAAKKTPILLVVDQFEEVFTMCRDDDEREQFVAALCAAARDVGSQVRVIITLRDDFLMLAEKQVELRPRLARGLQLLGTPAPADLRRILIEPARRAGYRFEDPDIATAMVDDVADLPSALPLLSFTAAKLWSLRDRHFKQLPTKAYHSLGGVVGALAQHAEDTLAEMSAAERELVRKAFRHLVTAEGTRASLTRDELRDVLGSGDGADPAIEKLIAARILVASEGERGEVMIEVVHEALLGAWPRLERWRREDAEGARLRDQLRAAARQWDERGRPAGLLWRGNALTEMQLWRDRFPGDLPATDAAFAEASAREARRGRLIRQALLLTAFLALVIGVVVLFRANRSATRSADEAQQRSIALLREQGRQAHLDGRPLDSILYLSRAHRLGARGAEVDYMLGQAINARNAELAAYKPEHATQFWGLAYRPDGSVVVAGDGEGRIAILDAKTGELIEELKEKGVVNDLAFSADGARMLSVYPDGSVAVWDFDAREKILELTELEPWIERATLSHDGKMVVTSDQTGVAAWEVDSGKKLWARPGPPAIAMAFSPDGTRLVISDYTNTIEILTIAGEVLGKGAGHAAPVLGLDWSADGEFIASAGADKTLRVWSGRDASAKQTIPQRGSLVGVAFSPDGKRLIGSGRFETASIHSRETGEELVALRGHTGFVNLARFSANGDELITASQDGTVRLWDSRRGVLLATFAGHTGFVWNALLDPVRPRAASVSWDGSVRFWDLEARRLVRFIPANVAAFDVKTGTVISASGPVVRFDRLDGGEPATQTLTGPVTAIAANDSHAFAAVGPSVVQLDLATGTVGASIQTEAPATAVAASVDHVAILDAAGNTVLAKASDLSKLEVRKAAEERNSVVAFAPSGELVVGGEHATVLSVPDLAVRAQFNKDRENTNRIVSIDFAPDGKKMLLGLRGDTSWVVDLEDSSELGISTPAPVFSARFSPSGKRAATVTMDGSVSLWDVISGQRTAKLEGHPGAALDVVFSPDGELLLSASADRTARLWGGDPMTLIDVFKANRDTVVRVWFNLDRSRAIVSGVDGVAVFKLGTKSFESRELEHFVRCRVEKELIGSTIRTRIVQPADCATSP